MNKPWLAAVFLVLLGGSCFFKTEAKKMTDIKFDLGKNIHEVAKKSGASGFEIETHLDVRIYELLQLPPDLTFHYTRTTYEISAHPVFSVTMYADNENKNDLGVERLEVSLSRHAARTHEQARTVVDDLIGQFRKGRWQRYISDACPAVTGRSSYLDNMGNIKGNCPLDHNFNIPMEDWLVLMPLTQSYEWVGDGVLATLVVRCADDSRGLTYTIDLAFQDFAIQRRRSAAEEAHRLAEGDKKGWRSTESHKNRVEENKKNITILEENAVKRGDHIVPRTLS